MGVTGNTLNEAVKRLKAIRGRLLSRLRASYLRALGVRVGRNVVFGGPVHTRFNGDPQRVVIEDDVVFTGGIDLRNRENGAIHIGRGCYFDTGLRLVAAREATIRIGDECSVGMHLVINAGGNVTIGQRCIISSYVHMNGSTHPIFRDAFMLDQGYVQGWVEVGEDCWLANCVNVAMNTRIGNGVIVAANSMAAGTIDDYTIVAGNPARIIGQRVRRSGAEPVQAVAERPLPRPAVPALQAMDELQAAFRTLFPDRPMPTGTDPLRASGWLGSLDWVMFTEEIGRRFGVDLPPGVATAEWFDSFQRIVETLYPETLTRTLPIPNAPYTVRGRLERLATEAPTAPALWIYPDGAFDGGPTLLTRATLCKAAARMAACLAAAGVRHGQRVAIIIPTSEFLVTAFLGCTWIGAIPSIFAYPSDKVPHDVYATNHTALFGRMNLAALVTTDALSGALQPLLNPGVRLLTQKTFAESGPQPPHGGLEPPAPGDIALIQHSSGTTGLQKGVALTHEAIARQIGAYARTLDLTDRDVVVSWLPLYHDMGLVACFLLPLMTGVPGVLMSPFDWIAAPWRLFAAIGKHGGTLAWLPNFAFAVLARHPLPDRLADLDLSGVRGFISCSEPVSAATMSAFHDRFAARGLGGEALWCCYAMAEAVFAVSQTRGLRVIEAIPDTVAPGRAVALQAGGRPFVSQGRPLSILDVRIAGDGGEAQAEGTVGEIQIRGPCLLAGYADNPEATAAAFQDGWYRTGDVGFLLDGELFVVGRAKDLLIVAGRNIHPQDIEDAAVAGGHLKPGRCCAFGIYNATTGTEDVVLVAERAETSGWSDDRIAADVRRRVMLALECALADVVLMESGRLLKTSSGKLARSAVKDHYLADRSRGVQQDGLAPCAD